LSTVLETPAKHTVRVASLVESIHRLGTRDSDSKKWVNIKRVATELGVKLEWLAGPLASATEDGLIETRLSDSGQLHVKLTGLATSLSSSEVDRGPTLKWAGRHDSPDVPVIVLALARMPGSSPLVQDLADNLDRDSVDVWDDLEAVAVLGLVETWADNPLGPSASLTALAASRLRLTLATDSSQWVSDGDEDPSIDRRRAASGDDPVSVLALKADPKQPEAFEVAAAAESAEIGYARLASIAGPASVAILAMSDDTEVDKMATETKPDWPYLGADMSAPAKRPRRRRRQREWLPPLIEGESLDGSDEQRIPRPVKILGCGKTWPIRTPGSEPPRRWTKGDGPCPSCGGRLLEVDEACVICDAMGNQALLDRIKAEPIPLDVPPVTPDLTESFRSILRSKALKGGRN
jgi:hypothetical protein